MSGESLSNPNTGFKYQVEKARLSIEHALYSLKNHSGLHKQALNLRDFPIWSLETYQR